MTLNADQGQPNSLRHPQTLLDPQDLLKFGQEITEWERIRTRAPNHAESNFQVSSLDRLAHRASSAAEGEPRSETKARGAEVTPLFRQGRKDGNR